MTGASRGAEGGGRAAPRGARAIPAVRARTVAPAVRRRAECGREAPRRTTEVDIRAVLGAICRHAREGYEERYKREVIGILLGRRGRRFRCLHAVPYRARLRARTRCDPNPEALRRRARALEAATGLRFLGCYHSHPEEAGSRAWALSPEDREIFHAERAASLEIVVSVAAAGRRARARAPAARLNKDGSLSLWAGGHHFRLSAEAKGPPPASPGAPRSARRGPAGREARGRGAP